MDVQNAYFQSRNARYKSLDGLNRINNRKRCSLALGGFYQYVNDPKNVLRCFYCGLTFSSLNEVDDIWCEHMRMVPRCMHVVTTFGTEFISRALRNENAQYTLNPEIIDMYNGNEFEGRNEHFYIPEPFEKNAPIFRTQQNAFIPIQPLFVTLHGTVIYDPKYPQMGFRERRQDSYMYIPKELPLEEINDNGFFLDSTRKFVCYFCGVAFDPIDEKFLVDPWKKHAMDSDCGHVHFTKGGSFTHQVRNGNIRSTSDYDRDPESFILRDLQMMEYSMRSVGQNGNGKRRKEEENVNDDENAVISKRVKENMGKQEIGSN